MRRSKNLLGAKQVWYDPINEVTLIGLKPANPKNLKALGWLYFGSKWEFTVWQEIVKRFPSLPLIRQHKLTLKQDDNLELTWRVDFALMCGLSLVLIEAKGYETADYRRKLRIAIKAGYVVHVAKNKGDLARIFARVEKILKSLEEN